ncbi:MAG: acetate kinase [bacterium]
MKVLVLNCGSSSVKYKLKKMEDESIIASGKVERIGMHNSILTHHPSDKKDIKKVMEVLTHDKAIQVVIDVLLDEEHGVIKDKSEITAVGQRVVHGGEKFAESSLVTEEVKADIKECFDLAPLHNHHNFRGIEAIERLLPGVPQVAVFDTSFHQTMPPHSYIYALPYAEYQKYGIRRYGFHGTSHRYVSEQAAKFMKKSLGDMKLITCHLGNGCSITAIDKGRSVDTSMGFTPLEGLVMGTRCGDLDPAIVIHILTKAGLSISEVDAMLNKHSGLDGISGISNDMREIMQEVDRGNKRAQLALDIFTYRLKKYIAAYAGAMGGVDAIVFTAGIGENVPRVREQSCSGLEFMGIKIDKEKNNETISKQGEIGDSSFKVRIFCIPTNEELIIARDTASIIKQMEA